MDLATTFCPNLDCPARGQIGQGNLGIHSRKEQRFICTQGRKTFTTTKGTAFYRVRTPTETVSLVLTFNEGIMVERLSGISAGHRDLLAMVEHWLEPLEEANR